MHKLLQKYLDSPFSSTDQSLPAFEAASRPVPHPQHVVPPQRPFNGVAVLERGSGCDGRDEDEHDNADDCSRCGRGRIWNCSAPSALVSSVRWFMLFILVDCIYVCPPSAHAVQFPEKMHAMSPLPSGWPST